jgi:hypothetical protein
MRQTRMRTVRRESLAGLLCQAETTRCGRAAMPPVSDTPRILHLSPALRRRCIDHVMTQFDVSKRLAWVVLDCVGYGGNYGLQPRTEGDRMTESTLPLTVNTKRSTCGPTPVFPCLGSRSGAISAYRRHAALFVASRANARPSRTQSTDANPGGGVTRAEIHWAAARKLFRQIELPPDTLALPALPELAASSPIGGPWPNSCRATC